MKAVRSMEMRGMISTSSSEAISSSSGGVIEFLNETGSAMTERASLGSCSRDRLDDHVMRRVDDYLVTVGIH